MDYPVIEWILYFIATAMFCFMGGYWGTTVAMKRILGSMDKEVAKWYAQHPSQKEAAQPPSPPAYPTPPPTFDGIPTDPAARHGRPIQMHEIQRAWLFGADEQPSAEDGDI